jgi:osmotically-inducible protein OsmY
VKPRRLFLLTCSCLAFLPLALSADPATDRKIEEAARSSYNFRVVLQKQIEVKCEDGIVTLTGSVFDRDQKTLAEETVRGLPGVVGVNNEITLSSPGHERADGWIALKIRSVLLLRANVSAAHTDVSVRDGTVTLTGTAETEAQKELTAAYAREVEGVKTVENRINVRPLLGSRALE